MNTVYDLIEELRDKSHLSTRRLATLAGIGSSTLASMLTRRPEKITVKYLKAIAKVFRLKWNYMLKMSDEEAATYDDASKVAVELEPGVGENVLESWMREMENEVLVDFDEVIDPPKSSAPYRKQKSENHFRESIILMLERLNDDGLMEVMRVTLEITKEPAFLKHPINNNKEDIECQENEQ